MGKSINPMFSFTIRGEAQGEAPFGSAPSLIVLMSLQPAIPRQLALLQCLPPLHRLDSMFHLPAGTVNHHLTRAGEFSTGVDNVTKCLFPCNKRAYSLGEASDERTPEAAVRVESGFTTGHQRYFQKSA